MRESKAVSDSEGRQYRQQEILVEIESISVLKQHRRVFSANDIRALADNICKWWLIDPITLAIFNPKFCQEYINLTNKYYGTNHRLADLPCDRIMPAMPARLYGVLLSGERRLRAHELIWEEGCSSCQKKFGAEKPGTCFARHFGRSKVIRAHAYADIPPLDAIEIQLSGNSYVPPSDAEMMETYVLQFRVRKEKNPQLTIAEFARSVGRDPSTISGYLKIYELPAEVLNFFLNGLISSGIARELAFLKDNGERDLLWWARRAIISRFKIEDFRKRVREHLASRQQTMLELFTSEAEKEAKRVFVKRVVAKEMIEGIYGNLAYFKKVLQLLEEGKLRRGESPFSAKSPTHLYREQVRLMREQVLPHMAVLLPKNSLRDIEKTLARVELTLAKQEERVKE